MRPSLSLVSRCSAASKQTRACKRQIPTATHISSQSSKVSSISYTPVRQFANSNQKNSLSELLEASNKGDIKKLQELVQSGVDVNRGDFDKRRALHVASAEGHLEVVKALLKIGVDVNAEDRWGNTALDDAILCKRDPILAALRESGGKVGKNRTMDVITSMCQAAAEGNVQQLQRYFLAGINLSLADYDLRTPLHVAASEGHMATVEFLIKNGANVNAMDRFGNTPLSEALRSRSKHRKSVVELLTLSGALVESKDYDIRRDPLLQGSISRSLQFVALRTNAAHVEVWMPNEDESEFVTSDTMWYTAKDSSGKLTKFLAASPESLYANAQSNLLGKAWQTKQAIYVADLTEKDMPNRFAEAKVAGLKSLLIVPVAFNDRPFCLLRLYTTSPIEDKGNFERITKFAAGCVAAGVLKRGKLIPHNQLAEMPKGQMAEVYDKIVGEEVFNANLVYHEVDWFYKLGIQKHYFERFNTTEIAHHVHSFIAAKKLAATTGKYEDIMLNMENKTSNGNKSFSFMCPIEHVKMVEVEKTIQDHIAKIPRNKPYTLEFFKSSRTIVPGGGSQLGLYVLETSDWNESTEVGSTESDLNKVASQLFLRTKSPAIQERYSTILATAASKISPLAEVFPTYRDGTIPVMFAFLQNSGTTTPYMLQLTELLQYNGMVAHRKFIEVFSNNIVVYSLYVNPCAAEKIDLLLKQFSMLHLVPESSLTPRFLSGEYSPEAYTYTSAASRFSYYFLNKRSEEFDVLAKSLKNDPLNLGRLRILQSRLKREAVSQERIYTCVLNYPSIIDALNQDFYRSITTPRTTKAVVLNPGILAKIKHESLTPLDEQILTTFLIFNTNILKTNFYKKSKASLCFRLEPSFFVDSDFPQVPFGLYFVMGSDFQGFHLRFRDIARGGIRIIRSADRQTYNHNLEGLLQENYGLAYTQNKKNKDIPEFGSKGTVLLALGQNNPFLSFQKYVSGLLDVTIGSDTVVDNYGKEEILFLGPDEGTADYMEWAARYASKRGYKYWRSFTTGKPANMGGIPHDRFGMTTRSVHRYVLGCLAKLGLKEEQVTKFQTGGPDGDLGSNEILLSRDRTLSIVDGSGVVYDPDGLDRIELGRLAKTRSMVKGFDPSKLGKGGFRVLITDTNVMLPDGELVTSGLSFRNEFHLHPLSSADLFVPCGGRPESVNLGNVKRLFDERGQPRFKIVVEGANLFLTQDARMVLEDAGVILYKDASANKGGVTSSSLEVLAALALKDDEFDQHMAVKDLQNPPKFYKEYVAEIQQRIETDADLEFECIWREHSRTGTHRYLLTDALSDKINTLNDAIQNSPLWSSHQLRTLVLSRAFPKRLQELLGVETIMKRVPESYLQAIFGAHLASRYVYKHGLGATEFAFFDFMTSYMGGLPGSSTSLLGQIPEAKRS